jgi:hypothetical protein
MTGNAKSVGIRKGASLTSKRATPAHPKRNRKLTDAERHERFISMAKQVGASESQTDFDKAFSNVVHPSEPNTKHATHTKADN